MKEQETTTTDFYIKGALYMYNSFERDISSSSTD